MQNHPSYINTRRNDALISKDGLVVERNGILYCHCQTLGAARALIRNVQNYAGHGDHWQTKSGDTVIDDIPANK